PAHARGAAARRPERQDSALQPAQARGHRFGGRPARRGGREGAAGAEGRQRGGRGLRDPRQPAHKEQAARRGDRGVSARAHPRRSERERRLRAGARLQAGRELRRRRSGLPARAADGRAQHQGAVAARRPVDAARRLQGRREGALDGARVQRRSAGVSPEAGREPDPARAPRRSGEEPARSAAAEAGPGDGELRSRRAPRSARRHGQGGRGLRGGTEAAPDRLPGALQPGEDPVAHRAGEGRGAALPRGGGRESIVRRRLPLSGEGAARQRRSARGRNGGAQGPELGRRAGRAAARPLRPRRRLHAHRTGARRGAPGRDGAAPRTRRPVTSWLSIVASLALAALTAACSRAEAPPARTPATPISVVVVTIDTLRADRIGIYGAKNVETPNIDRLAREGAWSSHSTAHVPLTRPSHVSIFSGRYPAEHGIRDNVAPTLAPEVPLLAEQFQRAGFATAGFVSSVVLTKQSGLARGFDTYSDAFEIGEDDARFLNTIQKRGDVATGEAIAWIKDHQKFFAWVHLYDPHDPYEPPGRYAVAY